VFEHTPPFQHMHDTELDALLRRQRIDVLTQELHLTAGYQAALRAQQAADRLQRRAFASAVGAQQCHHGALRHIDRNALDGERYMIVDDLDIVQ
jgi:hypothetical protein